MSVIADILEKGKANEQSATGAPAEEVETKMKAAPPASAAHCGAAGAATWRVGQWRVGHLDVVVGRRASIGE